MTATSPMWAQFRRLLLGTVVETLLEEHVVVDFRTLSISFHQDSEFRVPRLDNYMRFKGELKGALAQPPPAGTEARLCSALTEAWPQLLTVVDIPIGDRLTPDRNHIEVHLDEDGLLVRFDLVAD